MHLTGSWTSVLSLYSLFTLAATTTHAYSPNFENTAVVRSVDLGGASTQVTTTYQVRSLKDGMSIYSFVLSEDEIDRTSWIEAKLKGSSPPLALARSQNPHSVQYSATLPKPLKANETATLVLTTIQSHASEPVPATVRQTEPLYLRYTSDLYVPSPYDTVIQRLKFRTPTLQVKEYTTPKSTQYSENDGVPVTKSAATITYGPFRNVPFWRKSSEVQGGVEQISVHYEYDAPVTVVKSLKRTVELSHWGNNLNIQDNVWLKNQGAELKGTFSRLEHIKQRVHAGSAQPHIMRNIILHLPSGIRDPYVYDVIGNVSTTRFRPAPPRRQSALTTRQSPLERQSILDLTPRYPLLGGWNYTFTMGYDMPLQEWVSYDKEKAQYIVAVPFLTQYPGATFDDVETTVILPEGAKLVEYHLPFAVDETRKETHLTYLDSVGRPSIAFRKRNVANEHAQVIYVVYTVDMRAHLQKPLTVATMFFGVFTLAMTLRRIDWHIHAKKRT